MHVANEGHRWQQKWKEQINVSVYNDSECKVDAATATMHRMCEKLLMGDHCVLKWFIICPTYGCKSLGGGFFLWFCPASLFRPNPGVAGMWFTGVDDCSCCGVVAESYDSAVPLSSKSYSIGDFGITNAFSSSIIGAIVDSTFDMLVANLSCKSNNFDSGVLVDTWKNVLGVLFLVV